MLLNGRPTTIFYGQAVECSWLAKCQSKWACISLADGKKPLKQVGSKDGCLAEHHQREYQLSSDIYRFQLLIECKRTCKQIWKHNAFLSTCIWGILFKNSYNSIWCDYKTIKLKLININLIGFFGFFEVHSTGVHLSLLSKRCLLLVSLDEKRSSSFFSVTFSVMLLLTKKLLGWIMISSLSGVLFE